MNIEKENQFKAYSRIQELLIADFVKVQSIRRPLKDQIITYPLKLLVCRGRIMYLMIQKSIYAIIM